MKISLSNNGLPNAKLSLSGKLDEHAATSFMELRGKLSGSHLVIDLNGLGHINSMGLVSWTAFLSELPDSLSYSFDRCPAAFLDAAQILRTLFGRGTVESFYTTHYCKQCRHEWHILTAAKALVAAGTLDSGKCPECGGAGASDAPWEDYIEILARSA